jgi:hypothetical protein
MDVLPDIPILSGLLDYPALAHFQAGEEAEEEELGVLHVSGAVLRCTDGLEGLKRAHEPRGKAGTELRSSRSAQLKSTLGHSPPDERPEECFPGASNSILPVLPCVRWDMTAVSEESFRFPFDSESLEFNCLRIVIVECC